MLYIKRSDYLNTSKNIDGSISNCLVFYDHEDCDPCHCEDFIFNMEDCRLYTVDAVPAIRTEQLHVPVRLIESLDEASFNLLMPLLVSVDRDVEWRHIAADVFLVLALKDVGGFAEGLASFEKLGKWYA